MADNWKVWKQMWNNYMVVAQLKMKPSTPDTEGYSMELVLRIRPSVLKSVAASNRSTYSTLLQPFPGPHHTVWCELERPWHGNTSEWQAYRVRKSFPQRYGNLVCTNRERDAGDCPLSRVFQSVHIWLTCTQAIGNDFIETTHSSTSMPPLNDDEITEIWLHRVLWEWQEHALGQHAVKGLPALQRQRNGWPRISQHGLLSAHIRPASRRNKSGDPEGPVSARVVRDYSPRMAWEGACSSTDAP